MKIWPMKIWIAASAMVLLAGQGAFAEEPDCRLQIAAALPMQLDNSNTVSVPAAIQGHPIRMLVDTGAYSSTLQQTTADALGLKYEVSAKGGRGRIFGNIKMRRFVTVKDFTIGNLKADGISFMLMPPDERLQGAHDGLLGGNVLTKYDVDFDFANGKMNLFLPHRCPGKVVYWTADDDAVAKVPFRLKGQHIIIKLMLDGKEVEATLDTGATMSIMDMETYMPKYGLTPDSPGVMRRGGADNPYPRYSYTFKELSLPGVTVKNPSLTFVSQKYSHNDDYNMLLGMDVLRQLHLYIAYSEKMLYITGAAQH